MATRYAELSDLYAHGAPSALFGTLTSEQREAGLDAASAEADGALRARGTLPLVAWGADLRKVVSQIAAYDLLSAKGFNPNQGSDVNIRLRADDARKWLRGVAKSEVHPDVTFTTSSSTPAGARVRSKPLRGW